MLRPVLTLAAVGAVGFGVWKVLWLRFAFQLVVKPALRLRKQPSTW